MMKSWTKRERLLSVLAALAAVVSFFAASPLLGRLLAGNALLCLYFLFWIAALVMALPFFHWARRGRRLWRWALVLAAFLGLLFLMSRNLSAAAYLIAAFTDFYDMESTGFYLLFAMLCCGGMLAGVVLAAILAHIFPKNTSA